MSKPDLKWWDGLRHGGLLLDAQRLRDLIEKDPIPLDWGREQELRRLVDAMRGGHGDVPKFVSYVLQTICRFSGDSGQWLRGSSVPIERSRLGYAGEAIKPRQIWLGSNGAVLPVFIDREKRVGVGRGKRSVSQALQWLRKGNEHLALVTNGFQWRLIYAGLDFDAWSEWDIDLWFEEGKPSDQVTGLRSLLSTPLWVPPKEDEPFKLLTAIRESRKGQADLSQILGERVRNAVEVLVQGHGEVLKQNAADVPNEDIYRAAVRMVMRMVVVFFAEARGLLPRENQLYYQSYGLQGLREELERIRVRGGGRLARSYSAWPRTLSLFHLIFKGSHHESLQVPAYGGELFAPGDVDSADGMSRAIAIFENACYEHEIMPDESVYKILDLITRTRAKIRQGRSSTTIPVPVDFSDLSSEYIGILYEGLLDFELRTAPEDDPVVFLSVGNQPALPLSRLEEMEDKAIKELFEKLKDTGSSDDDDDVEVDEPEESDEPDAVDDENGDEETVDEEEEAAEDARHSTRSRAEEWGRKAVVTAKLVKKPRGRMSPERKLRYEEDIGRKARQLVSRIMLPGEWYLVRWGGTRKGSGTFYTRPGLAVPTVQRTLRPLAFDPPKDEAGNPLPDAPAVEWKPKLPEEILSLKVCDPACGSGSFPVAALRYLTEALYHSLDSHQRMTPEVGRTVVTLLGDREGDEERLGDEYIACRPEDDEFEPRMKAILRRHVVERCIYGVDLDPLAVELCRLALWVETMDRRLPFSFLDHKVKCGNSLVGAWFDQFKHYPVMAWKNREGGDKGHSNGVHFEKNERTKAIKAFVRDRLVPDLVRAASKQWKLGEQVVTDPGAVHDDALGVLAGLHELPVHDSAEKSRIFREEILGSDAWRSLKSAMDLWCACWFWPTGSLSAAPLPSEFGAPTQATLDVVVRLSASMRFFHWELEYPDVFAEEGAGFDAVLGNPPWDVAKPNSKEFFSNIDPLYRSYGKQEGLRRQTEYFADESIESNWLDYNAFFRAQSNYLKYAAIPFGDPEQSGKGPDRFSAVRGKANAEFHALWRKVRSKGRCYSDPQHTFRHQGSADINLYKLFLEQSHVLLRGGGRLGFIVPSGLYSDQGTGALRELFLGQCQWEWLFGFENRDKIFDIDSRFKFNPVIIQKGDKTEAIKTAFMRRRLEDWETGEEFATPYTFERVEQFSPKSKTILEIQSARDLEILEKIYANSVLLGDDGPDGWGITYAREFDMTNDSKLFPARPKWEEKGYRPDEYSRWLLGKWRPIEELWAELGVKPLAEGERRCAQPPYDRLPVPRADIPEGWILSREADAWTKESEIEGVALPLYEGRMIGQFDYSQKGWASGKGRSAKWPDIPWDYKYINPQYLLGENVYRDELLKSYLKAIKKRRGKDAAEQAEALFKQSPEDALAWWLIQRLRVGFIDVTSATNERTTFAALVGGNPCGNSAPVLKQTGMSPALMSVMNTFAYDAVARFRCSGLHLNWFVIDESPLPHADVAIMDLLNEAGLRLCGVAPSLSDAWVRTGKHNSDNQWKGMWAVTQHERLRLRAVIDAIVADLYGISEENYRHILRDSDYDREDVLASVSDNAKGFWRVDRGKQPSQRLTVLSIVAYSDLGRVVAENHGDRLAAYRALLGEAASGGWQLPYSIRLSDYGLSKSRHASESVPLGEEIGDAVYEWQISQSCSESWKECMLHSRNMLGQDGFQCLVSPRQESGNCGKERKLKTDASTSSGGSQGELFS